VNIGVTNQKQWVSFCTELEISELISDPRFSTTDSRLVHYSELKPILDRTLGEFTRSDVLRKMAKAAIPAGPVNTVAEVLEDPQMDAREMIKHLTHPEYGPIRVLGLPVKLSDTPGIVEGPPPIFGEHNRFVLAMLGYTENAIAGLEKDGTLVSRKEGI